MPKVNSIAEALKLVRENVQSTLFEEVAQTIKEVEIKHVNEDVYSREPSGIYNRRYSHGGIGDIANLEQYVEHGANSDTLGISNNTKFNPYINGVNGDLGFSRNSGYGLEGLIEHGDGWNGITYDWAEGEPARPFIQNSINDLKASKEHVRALAEGLRKRGLDVKTAR
jgi:hypothetical protein